MKRKSKEPDVPEFLYRYRAFRDENRSLELLFREGFIYFASPVRFDDPEDLRFPGALAIEAHVRRLAADAGLDETEIAATIEKFQQDPYRTIRITEAIQSILNRMGVLCLAETPTSRDMWRLYADNGRGACIRFHFGALVD